MAGPLWQAFGGAGGARAAALGLVAALLAAPASAQTRYGLPDFSPLVTSNAAAVVNISTDQVSNRPASRRQFDLPDLPEDSPFRDFLHRFLDEMPEERDARSLGSGFVISADGYILTSAHVIDGADHILVRFADRRELDAEVVGTDERSDVALLKVEGRGLPSVTIGNADDLNVGEWVLAIGSPFGFESTATAGIVSAKGRSLPNENYVPFIQTDVAINPGNSGGPLFNLDGEVVGINAQIYSRTGGFMGLSFAVPINIAMRVAGQLRESGSVRRGWLGVAIQDVTRELAESFGMDRPQGALISDILPNSPAKSSDLVPGDIIVAFNGEPVARMSELPPLVGRTLVGDVAKLEVVRGGETRVVEVTIGELPGDEVVQVTVVEPPVDESLLGLTVIDIEPADLASLELDNGVLVKDIESGPGSRAGIRAGDIVTQFNGLPVESVERFRALVEAMPADRSVPVLIRRGERSLFLALKSAD